jgi:hypothetical protein
MRGPIAAFNGRIIVQPDGGYRQKKHDELVDTAETGRHARGQQRVR